MRMKFFVPSSSHFSRNWTFIITLTVRVSTVADYFVLWDLEWLGAT